MHIRTVLTILAVTLSFFMAGCTKSKHYPSPNDTVMGSGYDERPDYVASADAYQGSLENEGLMPREHSLSNGELAADSRKHAFVSVFFKFDNFSIEPNERPKLVEAAKRLETDPQCRFLIVGHCDYHGTAEYNMALGEKRAKSIRDYLERIGCSADRIETLSRGDLDASARAGTPTETAQDRRGDVVVVK